MVLDRVKELVAEQLNISKESITENSNVVDDLGADSLDVIEMLMTLEEEFGVTIPDEQIGQIRTISQIVDLIDNNKK